MRPAIDTTAKTYAIWDLADSALIAGDDLLAYDAVIWETGANDDVLDADDRAVLDPYLAAGGNLILAGEDILAKASTTRAAPRACGTS